MTKFIFVFATALATTLGAYAALPTGNEPSSVTVPNLKGGMEFSVGGMLLTPSASNPGETGSSQMGSGFSVGSGYVAPNSGNDAQVSVSHYGESSSDSH